MKQVLEFTGKVIATFTSVYFVVISVALVLGVVHKVMNVFYGWVETIENPFIALLLAIFPLVLVFSIVVASSFADGVDR